MLILSVAENIVDLFLVFGGFLHQFANFNRVVLLYFRLSKFMSLVESLLSFHTKGILLIEFEKMRTGTKFQ